MFNTFHEFYNQETGEIIIRKIMSTNFDKTVEDLEKFYKKKNFIRIISQADYFNMMEIEDFENNLKSKHIFPYE